VSHFEVGDTVSIVDSAAAAVSAAGRELSQGRMDLLKTINVRTSVFISHRFGDRLGFR